MEFLHPYRALERNLKNHPKQIAFGCLRLGKSHFKNFHELNWEEVHQKVRQYALLLESKGLKAGDKLAIQSRNQASWVILDWACMAKGIISVPLYPQSIDEEVKYIINEAEVKLLISEEQRSGLPCDVMLIEDFEEESKSFSPDQFKFEASSPDDIATIIYTSGTTGEPKGVVHRYQSMHEAIKEGNVLAKLTHKDRMISYLPLSHVVERVLADLGSLYLGMSLYFIDQVDRVPKMLPIVQPTVFAAVPRIWDLMLHKIERQMETSKAAQLMKRFLPSPVANSILGKMLRKKLGFGQSRLLLSGAAKLNEVNAKKLESFGIRITEGYGLTETFAITAFNDPTRPKLGSVGKPFPNVQVKIAGDGEILIKAKHNFVGYFKKPEETAKVVKDGWFHSGDIGTFDSEGRLLITDRKKDIFKTTNGKYVAPQPIELEFKTIPFVQEAMVVGENRPYCVAVLSLNNSEVSEKDLVELMDRVNSKLPMHEKIHSVMATRRTWSVDAGELTPSMKLKRRQILNRYQKGIDGLYNKREKCLILDEESEDQPVIVQEVGQTRAYSCI